MIRPSTMVTHSPDRGHDHGEDWRVVAACAHDPNPRSWDPEAGRDEHDRAVKVCLRECPVLDQCSALAKRHRPDGGVWAGRVVPERSHGTKTKKDPT